MIKEPYDIIFYYPQHFNRNKKGENPFFLPLINICKSKDINYLIIEEPDNKTLFPRNKEAIKFDLYFYIILILRKIIPLSFFKNSEKKEQCIGSIIRKITLFKFKAKTIITLSNAMGGFWRGYNVKAKIIDYQHGIINKNQPGFFSDGNIPLHIIENNKEVAVWGKGFYDVFFQNKNYYNKKVHILGYSQFIQCKEKNIQYENKIIFSLQFVPEYGIKLKKEMKNEIQKILEDIKSFPNKEKPNIFFMNHPRNNNIQDLNDIIKKYKFASILPHNELAYKENYLLHLTFYSTTTFEMALKGIPTYFLSSKNILDNKIFLKDYKYPINQNTSFKELVSIYQKDKKTRRLHGDLVKKWSSHYFQPLNQNIFLKLLNN